MYVFANEVHLYFSNDTHYQQLSPLHIAVKFTATFFHEKNRFSLPTFVQLIIDEGASFKHSHYVCGTALTFLVSQVNSVWFCTC